MVLSVAETQSLARLRRLIDDAGRGYSISAPNFATDIHLTATPKLRFSLDGGAQVEVSMGSPGALTTGEAIALAIQNAIRTADPATPPATTAAYANATCRFDPREGYQIVGGTKGAGSSINIFPALASNDVATLLKLGTSFGGYETASLPEMSDTDLLDILDFSLAEHNAALTTDQFTWDTITGTHEVVVTYRAWGNVIDTMLGKSAQYFPQQIELEKSSPDKIFQNLLQLRNKVDSQIAKLMDTLNAVVVVATALRWDNLNRAVVNAEVYDNRREIPTIVSVTPLGGLAALLVFDAALTTDVKDVLIGYSPNTPVIDQTVFTANPPDTTLDGFVLPAKIDRTLHSTKFKQVKFTNLPTGVLHFAIQIIDRSGNRYFSNEITATIT